MPTSMPITLHNNKVEQAETAKCRRCVTVRPWHDAYVVMSPNLKPTQAKELALPDALPAANAKHWPPWDEKADRKQHNDGKPILMVNMRKNGERHWRQPIRGGQLEGRVPLSGLQPSSQMLVAKEENTLGSMMQWMSLGFLERQLSARWVRLELYFRVDARSAQIIWLKR